MSQKTYIYLIRHGEVKNPNKIIYGRLPKYGLSRRGRLQVKKLAEFFKNIKLDAVYASPLLRSRQTARSVLSSHPRLKIHYSKDLLEINNKLWEGIKWSDRDEKLVQIYKNFPTKLNVSGLEKISEVEKRMAGKIDRIIRKHEGGKVAVFSHADTIRVARLHYEGQNLDKLHESICTNASITTLVFNGGKLIQSHYKEVHPRADEAFWTKTKKELV